MFANKLPSNVQQKTNSLSLITWLLYLLLLVPATLVISWVALAKADFLFPMWYDVLDIEQNITQYAPNNQYKQDFALTLRTEREQLFSDIVTSIHNDGMGLSLLTYHDAQGNMIDFLLRKPEVIHLQDVANLLNLLLPLGFICLLVSMCLFGLITYKAMPPPSGRHIGFSMGILCVLIAVLLGVFGPTTVFYQLHIWIFPADHQWFFYYEESLMTTLMKAPDIFAAIAIAIVLVASLLYAACYLLAQWSYRIRKVTKVAQ